MLSYRAWQQQYGSDPSIVGSTIHLRWTSVHHHRHHAAGFFGETLRSDPPDIWVPLQQEPMFRGEELPPAHLPCVAAGDWPVAPGRVGHALPARLTSQLRLWLVDESGMPADWMTGLKARLPKQNIHVIPAGTGVGVMKEDYGASLHILLDSLFAGTC